MELDCLLTSSTRWHRVILVTFAKPRRHCTWYVPLLKNRETYDLSNVEELLISSMRRMKRYRSSVTCCLRPHLSLQFSGHSAIGYCLFYALRKSRYMT